MAEAASMALQVAQARRLIISEMELENFKSYAGVQRVGPFHKVLPWCGGRPRAARWQHLLRPPSSLRLQSFSSVVGPNGSGKSNVIDAMLFVFGKRAKQARPPHRRWGLLQTATHARPPPRAAAPEQGVRAHPQV